MTPAERAYRLALLAYPAAYRRERGLEILTTILDAGDRRWPPRGRELVAIVLDGVARRGHVAGGGSRAGSLRAGVRLAAFAWFWIYAVVGALTALGPYIGPDAGSFEPRTAQTIYGLLLALLPVLALVRSLWWGPLAVYVAGLGVEATGWPWGPAMWPWDVGNSWSVWVQFALIFVPGLACALARPRAGEPADARALAWLPAAVVAGAVISWQGLFLTTWLGWPLAVSVVLAFGLARRDPRLAAAAACFALLAAVERLLGEYNVVWLGTSSLIVPSLILLVLALAWRLRPTAALS
jgi:hypothetical protein